MKRNIDEAIERILLALPADAREEERERLSRPIADIGISVKAVNSLEVAGIFSVGQLLMRRPSELLLVTNIGKKTLDEIISGLETLGYYRKGSLPTESEKQVRDRRRKLLRTQFGF